MSNETINRLRFQFPARIVAQGEGSYLVTPGRPVECRALHVREVAAELAVSEQQVINLIDAGEMEAVNVGDGSRRHWRVRIEALVKFMEAHSSLRV